MLDIQQLEPWLWDAACAIRGPVDAPKFKDYILPLVFLKRLSDVYDDEITRLADEFGSRKTAERLAAEQRGLVRFYVPQAARWEEIRQRTTGLDQYLTDAVRALARENPALQGVVDTVDFNATAAGQRILDDPPLAELIQVLSRHRLGLREVEPDILGRAYESFWLIGQPDDGRSLYPRQVFFMSRLRVRPTTARATPWRLAKMSLAVRGIAPQIAHGDALCNDHSNQRCVPEKGLYS